MRNEFGAGEEMKNLQSAMLKSVFKNSATGTRPFPGAATRAFPWPSNCLRGSISPIAAPGDGRDP
jgi:hypothetical protein